MHCTIGSSTRTPTEPVTENALTITSTQSVLILPDEVARQKTAYDEVGRLPSKNCTQKV